jgi:divalent metal cation (Fe/Co/Zn/Cd) transporter
LPRSLLIYLGGIYDPSFANVIGNIHLFAAAQLSYDLIKSLVSSARSNAQAGKKRKAVDADEVAGEVKRKKVLSAAADLI